MQYITVFEHVLVAVLVASHLEVVPVCSAHRVGE